MFQITEQQIENRWNVLPMRLLEVLCFFDIGKIISEICKRNHIIGEKSDKISGLTGFVIMGFIHPEDLAQEIKISLNFNPELSNVIASEINRKIFTPIRSEIDKVYAPAGALAEEKLAEENLAPAEISEEHIVDLRTMEKLTDDLRPTTDNQQPTTNNGEKPTLEEKTEISKGEQPFDMAQDRPFIIHKEEGAKPILGGKRSLGGLFGFLKGGKEPEQKAVEAKIEIGRTETETEQKLETNSQSPEPPKMKVVHYSEFLTPIADQQPMTNDQRPIIKDQQPITDNLQLKEIESSVQIAARVFEQTTDDKNAVPRPPAASTIQQKKDGEEIIDLRTMRKITE